MKLPKYLLFFIFTVTFSSICFGQVNNDFINDKTIIAYYGNVGYIYNTLKHDLIEGYEKKDPQILNAIRSFKSLTANIPNQNISRTSDDELIKMVKDWDNDGFIVPKGLLKFSFSSDRTFYISLEAKIDTNYILNKIRSSFPENSLNIKENNGIFSLKLPTGTTIEKNNQGVLKINIPDYFVFYIRPNGLTIDKLSNKELTNKSWNTMLKNLSDNSCFMHTELDVKTLYETLKDNETFKRPNLKNLMEIMSNITRLRFIGKKNNYIMIAAIKDEDVRTKYLNQYSQMIQNNNNSNQVLSIISSVWKDVKIIDKSPWIGSQTNTNSEFISAMGLVSLVSFSSPFIQRFLDRLSIIETDEKRGRMCLENLKAVIKAQMLYTQNNNDIDFSKINNAEFAEKTFQDLINKGFMKNMPKCPYTNKVTYFTKPGAWGFYEFYCPIHGTIAKPNFVLTEQKIEPNSAEGQKQECFSNCEIISRRLSAYNFNRLDKKEQQIRTMSKGDEAKKVIDKLIKEGLLKSEPKCPSTGKMSYFSEGDIENFGVIECEVHGTPFEKKSEFEINEFKKREDRMKCHFNLQWLNSYVEMYNTNNEDKITVIKIDEAENILKKVYGDRDIPVCPTTGKYSYYTEGDFTQGYHVQCEIHGLPRKYNK